MAADLPRRAWQVRSAGAGAHGLREYEWAWVDLHPRIATSTARARTAATATATATATSDGEPGRRSWSLLVRRHPRTKEMAYYLCYSPGPTTLGQLVKVAGRRWAVEESFQASKGLAGLDEHQVRTWTSWRRWTLLAMLAHAVLAVITALERRRRPAPPGLIDLTCAEVRRLLLVALTSASDTLDAIEHALAWSHWRRTVQYRAKVSHYKSRGHTLP